MPQHSIELALLFIKSLSLPATNFPIDKLGKMIVYVSQDYDKYDNDHLTNVCPGVHLFLALKEYDSVDSFDLQYGKKWPKDKDC